MNGEAETLYIDFMRKGVWAGHEGRVWDEKLALPTNITVCTSEAWCDMGRLLAESDVLSWPKEFGNPNVCDGEVWDLYLMNGTNVVRRYWRSNDAPSRFRSFYKIKREAFARVGISNYDMVLDFDGGRWTIEWRANGDLPGMLADLEAKEGCSD